MIQNAGTKVLLDGSGRDRGDYSINGRQFHEEDRGQYDSPEEVFAFCGASALLRRRMLEDVGLFDDSFFVYYEDMDLSWRARLRGWKILYTPTSIVRHIHCGTSVEWSPFFTFHAERNRLNMLVKNAPAPFAARSCLAYVRDTLRLWRWSLVRRFNRDSVSARASSKQAFIKSRVLVSIARRLPMLLWRRAAIRGRRVVGDVEIMSWMVEA